MLSNLNAAHRQHKVTNNNGNSFIDILAVLLTGGVGIFIALLGLYFDDLPFLIIGYVIALASAWTAVSKAGKSAKAGKSTIELMREYRDYKAERKNKDQ